MRVEIGLGGEVTEVEAPDIAPREGQRDAQRHAAAAVFPDQPGELGAGRRVEDAREDAREAPERLRVTGARRADGECLHEARAVPREPGARERPRRRDEPAEPREPGRAVREEGELLRRGEGDEGAAPRRGRQEGAPARGRRDPLEEMVSDRGGGEAALLLYGEQGNARDQGPL